MNILFWSHGKSFTIENMARSLKAEDESLSMDLVQNRSDRVEQSPDGPFRDVYDLRSLDKWGKLGHLPSLLSGLSSHWEYALEACSLQQSPRRLSMIGGLLMAGRVMNERLRSKNYDLIQFSFPFHLSDIVPFFGFQAKCPIVIHFWGSDLFRVANLEKLSAQKRLVKRAQHVIAATPEMKAIIQYKYGLETAPKVKRLRIGSDDEIYQRIEEGDPSTAPISASEDKIVIQIGYNASRLNQHSDIIERLGNCSLSERHDLHFVLPMTYNGGENYIQTIRSTAERNLCNFTILEDFLPESALAALRSRTDIVINTPLTDALNSAMTEALYAGSIVINGSWLPYKDLQRHGFSYTTVDDLSGVPNTLARIIDKDVHSLREKLAHENRGVREYASWSRLAAQWVSFYRSIAC